MSGFDTTVFPRLPYGDVATFRARVAELRAFWDAADAASVNLLREKGRAYAEAFASLDSFIQTYTAQVCPYCGTVCCMNKHGFPEFADMAGFLAMDLDLPTYDLEADAGALCQFIGPKGCVLPRPQRPYRCTWYFCEPLLIQIEIGPTSHYRKFLKDVGALTAARADLMRNLYELWRR